MSHLAVEVDPELVVVNGPVAPPVLLMATLQASEATNARPIEMRGVCLSKFTARIQEFWSCNVNHVSPLSHIDFSDNGATFGFNVN